MANAYLSRTPGSAGNRQIFTWSAWVRRGDVNTSGVFPRLFFANNDSSNTTDITLMDSSEGGGSNELRFISLSGGSAVANFQTNADLKDPSAWYHFVVAVDTTQGTESNRVKIYINGVLQTSFKNSSCTQNINTYINSTSQHRIGHSTAYGSYFKGGMTDIFFVDGQQLAASVFGVSETTGKWKAKSPAAIRSSVGSFGTNGFYLPFTDATSTTTLGYDYKTANRSSNNDWTLNNIATTDASLDTNDNTFAILNHASYPNESVITMSEGGLRAVGDNNHRVVKATHGVRSGKWYWECKFVGSTPRTIGIATNGTTLNNWIGSDSTGWGAYWDSGTAFAATGGATVNSYSGTWASNGIAMYAFDADNGKMYIGYNGTWLGTQNPATGANAAWTGIPSGGMNDYYMPAVSVLNDGANSTPPIMNFGQGTFVTSNSGAGYADGNGKGRFQFTPPSGFLAICEDNMTDPSVTPSTACNVILWNGDGNTSRAITGLGFRPDIVWAKSRSGADTGFYHRFGFSLLPDNNYLSTHNDDGLQTANGIIDSYDSDGFTVNRNGGAGINESGSTYGAWCWNMGGTSVSNTNGTITSTVRANPTYGQSIFRFTGVTGGTSVGHGLSQAPELVMLKTDNVGSNWVGWFKYYDSGNLSNIIGFSLPGQATVTGYWGSSQPDATKFYVNSAGTWDCNYNGRAHTGFAFHSVPGYSKFGTYTGTGATYGSNGPYVYLGFKPKVIMIKNISGSTNYLLRDSVRDPFNTSTTWMCPNALQADTADAPIDFLSNGFRIRASGTPYSATNGAGNTIMYWAWAENPFDYSNAK